MVSKNRIGKVAGVALAAGVLAVAGLGLGTASADNGGMPGSGAPGPQQMRPPRPGQNGPNGNRPTLQQLRPRPGQGAPNAANNQEVVRAKGIISAAAEVMAVQPQTLVAELEQGQTLTQVAAAHGLSRDYFLSELVAQVEKDVKDGQRFGIPALADLNAQLASLIDEAGLGLRGTALSNLF